MSGADDMTVGRSNSFLRSDGKLDMGIINGVSGRGGASTPSSEGRWGSSGFSLLQHPCLAFLQGMVQQPLRRNELPRCLEPGWSSCTQDTLKHVLAVTQGVKPKKVTASYSDGHRTQEGCCEVLMIPQMYLGVLQGSEAVG